VPPTVSASRNALQSLPGREAVDGERNDELTNAAAVGVWQGHVYSCYSAMIREDDKSPTQSTSTGVASSGVSVAAHAGGSGSPSPGASVSVGANNAAGTAPPATTDKRNKRRRLRSPQRQ
jgi:hypothetical protein